MATPALTVEQNKPKTPEAQEPSRDTPVIEDKYAPQLQKYGQALINLQRVIRDYWAWKRRGIVAKVIRHKEMDKGNHFTGFWEDSQEPFDAMEEFRNFTATNAKTDDRSLRRHYENFYTMLLEARVAVLSADIPKTRFLPANADEEEDRQTAKVGSKVQTIIERKNKIPSMVRQEIRELGTSGCYFKYTRYVVDGDRTGTHKEPDLTIKAQQVVPARYFCFNCLTTTPEDVLMAQKSLNCPKCGQPLGQQNYLESHIDQAPLAESFTEVPNGMVMQNVYGPLHVDADPDSPDLLNTRLLNLSEEVPLGWLRMTFPEQYDKFQPGQSSGSANELLERQYRSRLTTPANYSGWMGYSTPDKCTYSRVWIQPMAYMEMEDQTLAAGLKKDFPDGVMLAYQDDLALQIRPAKLTKQWTWCGASEGYGLFPPPQMEPGMSFQERIDDICNIIHDWMDRMAGGILLALEKYIDTKAMNGKQIMPGTLTPVAMAKTAPPGSIQDMIYQVKTALEPAIFTYAETLRRNMSIIVGAPPQLFGGESDPHVETKGGQEQQLSTAMGKLGLTWQYLRVEHTEAAQNAVECAADNMTEDWFDVVTDETQEARNEYVHLDEMQGSVRAEPESDQGFPMTWSEIKDFFMRMLDSSNRDMVDWLIQEPKNIDTMMRYVGVPGLVAPGGAMRDKALGVFGQLIQGKPMQQSDPITGQPTLIPALKGMPILPNKYLDDLNALEKMIPIWAQEHWLKLKDNPNGVANLVAFYKMTLQMMKEKAAEMQMGAPQQPAGPQAPGVMPQAIPPQGMPQMAGAGA